MLGGRTFDGRWHPATNGIDPRSRRNWMPPGAQEVAPAQPLEFRRFKSMLLHLHDSFSNRYLQDEGIVEKTGNSFEKENSLGLV